MLKHAKHGTGPSTSEPDAGPLECPGHRCEQSCCFEKTSSHRLLTGTDKNIPCATEPRGASVAASPQREEGLMELWNLALIGGQWQ
jgi:hypothetical protein